MPYCEILASRVRDELIDHDYYSERRMFGSIAFMLHRKMACGVTNGNLIVRISAEDFEECIAKDYVRVFFNEIGKLNKNWILVDGDMLGRREDLLEWINRGVSFCLSLSD